MRRWSGQRCWSRRPTHGSRLFLTDRQQSRQSEAYQFLDVLSESEWGQDEGKRCAGSNCPLAGAGPEHGCVGVCSCACGCSLATHSQLILALVPCPHHHDLPCRWGLDLRVSVTEHLVKNPKALGQPCHPRQIRSHPSTPSNINASRSGQFLNRQLSRRRHGSKEMLRCSDTLHGQLALPVVGSQFLSGPCCLRP
jgi:hypothetical protein